MSGTLTQQELEAAHCWEAVDRVRHPAMTDFRRSLRYHQARWREANGHPIGSQPMVPKSGAAIRLVGSRLPLDYARETGANFLTSGTLAAARARESITEPHQSFDHQGLWADLLSSTALSFNLFGDLAADLGLADRAVHTWWPDTPGTVSDVRFAHSPGRLDAAYTGNLIALGVAFVLELDDRTKGILGLDIKYHERIKRELPKPTRLPRYIEVAKRSGVFGPKAIEAVNGTDLLVMWLEHLLLLSMLQHPSGTWNWGRYVVVHPAGNSSVADGCARLKAAGYLLVVVTNQPDVGRGTQTRAEVDAMHDKLLSALPIIDRIEVCFHAGSEHGEPCLCRKPQPGMLLAAAAALQIDLRRSYLIGDRWRDIDCARAAGCRAIFIDRGYDEPLRETPDAIVHEFGEAVALIVGSDP